MEKNDGRNKLKRTQDNVLLIAGTKILDQVFKSEKGFRRIDRY